MFLTFPIFAHAVPCRISKVFVMIQRKKKLVFQANKNVPFSRFNFAKVVHIEAHTRCWSELCIVMNKLVRHSS